MEYEVEVRIVEGDAVGITTTELASVACQEGCNTVVDEYPFRNSGWGWGVHTPDGLCTVTNAGSPRTASHEICWWINEPGVSVNETRGLGPSHRPLRWSSGSRPHPRGSIQWQGINSTDKVILAGRVEIGTTNAGEMRLMFSC